MDPGVGRHDRQRRAQVGAGCRQPLVRHALPIHAGRRRRLPRGERGALTSPGSHHERVGAVPVEGEHRVRARRRRIGGGREQRLLGLRHPLHVEPGSTPRRQDEQRGDEERRGPGSRQRHGGAPAQQLLVAGLKARVQRDGRHAEERGGQEPDGRDSRREVERAVREKPGEAGQRAHRHTEAVRIVADRLLALAAVHRAGPAAEQMGPHEIAHDAPAEEQAERGPDGAQLDGELEQVVVRVGVIDLRGQVCGRLVAHVEIAVATEAHAEHRKLGQHRQRRDVLVEPVGRSLRRLRQAGQQRAEADPAAVGDDGHQQQPGQHEAAASAADRGQHEDQREQRRHQVDEAAAAEGEHERHAHDDDAQQRHVAPGGLLAQLAHRQPLAQRRRRSAPAG